MKTTHLFFSSLVLLLAIGLTACDNDDPQPQPDPVEATMLKVSINSNPLSYEAQTDDSWQVKCDGDWKFTETPDWCTLDISEGRGDTTLVMKVSANDTGQERFGRFIISTSTLADTVYKIQTEKVGTISGNSLQLDKAGRLHVLLRYTQELKETEQLIVTGNLNCRDLSQFTNELLFPNLSSIDLKEVQVAETPGYSEEPSILYKANEFSGFSGFKRLQHVILPESLTSIGFEAFNNCEGLKTLTIPHKVETTGLMAFAGCKNLESIYFSNQLKHLEEGAFFHCEKLKAIHIANPVPPELNPDAFAYFNTSACTLYVPEGSKTAYETNGWNLFKEIVEE